MTMKPDDNLPNHPDLEARIVAWVLGEASPFEIAELERRVAEDPALAVFKRRMEAVHGLVGEAARAPINAPKLSAERREKLLAAIGAQSETAAESSSVLTMKPLRHRPWWRVPVWAIPAAACLLVGIFAVYETQWRVRPAENAGVAPVRLPAVTDTEMVRQRVQSEESRGKVVVAASLVAKEKAQAYASAGIQKAAKLEDSGLSYPMPPPVVSGAGAITSRDPAAPVAKLPAVTVVAEREGYARASADAQSNLRIAPSVELARDRTNFDGVTSVTFSSTPIASGSMTLNAPADVRLAQSNNTFGNGTANVGYSQGAFGALKDNRSNINQQVDAVADLDVPAQGGLLLQGGKFDQMTSTAVGWGPTAAAPQGSQTFAQVRGGGSPTTSVGGAIVSNDKRRDLSTADDQVVTLDSFAVQSARDVTPADKRKIAQAIAGARKAAHLVPAAFVPENRIGAAGGAVRTNVEADRPIVHPAPPVDEQLRAEVSTQQQPVSTFSLHVSDVSFRLAQAALDRGDWPDPATIRPEEFYNAFDYGDPSPLAGEPVACRIEQATQPFLQQRNLVRIAMKVPATGRGASQPLRLTVLLDTSGSMEREDRVNTVRRAVGVLASLLGPNDRVTLIGFARQPRLLAEGLRGNEAAKLVDLIDHLPAEGGTNLEEALKLASAQALRQFAPQAQNRVVVLTDGAANLGNDDPAHLATQVEALRQQGIAFDACGIGIVGLDDSVLEALTRKGAGRYYLINSPEEADTGFAQKLAGSFRPAAENVKVQVRFNPSRVLGYRLIGFEQHRLRAEDFRNDKIEAAELAAEEAAVALYQVEIKPDGEGELGDVFVRFRHAESGAMVERSWTLSYDPQPLTFAHAPASLQLAGTAALLAEKLRGGAPAAQIRLEDLAPTLAALRAAYPHNARVNQLVHMVEQTRHRLNE
jgi:Ca-activated chloride channel homolog